MWGQTVPCRSPGLARWRCWLHGHSPVEPQPWDKCPYGPPAGSTDEGLVVFFLRLSSATQKPSSQMEANTNWQKQPHFLARMATPLLLRSQLAMTRARVSGLASEGLSQRGFRHGGITFGLICLWLIQSPLLQVGMALLKFLQTKQIFPAVLAFHTLLLTAMARTGTVDHSYSVERWTGFSTQVSIFHPYMCFRHFSLDCK